MFDEPPLQLASVTAAMESVVETVTVTLRVNDVVVMPLCVTPSDQTSVNGAWPVRVTGTATEPAPQTAIDGGSVAVGRGTVAMVLLDEELQPFAVTVTWSTTLPPSPLRKKTSFVAAPRSSVPFVIDQA